MDHNFKVGDIVRFYRSDLNEKSHPIKLNGQLAKITALSEGSGYVYVEWYNPKFALDSVWSGWLVPANTMRIKERLGIK